MPLLTFKQISEKLGVHMDTVRKWAKYEKWPVAETVGRLRLFDPIQIERLHPAAPRVDYIVTGVAEAKATDEECLEEYLDRYIEKKGRKTRLQWCPALTDR